MKRNKINRKFRRNLAVSLMTLCSAQEMVYGMEGPIVYPGAIPVPKMGGVGNIPAVPGNIPVVPVNIPNAPPLPQGAAVNVNKKAVKLENTVYFDLAAKLRNQNISDEEKKQLEDMQKQLKTYQYTILKKSLLENQESDDKPKNVQWYLEIAKLYSSTKYAPEVLLKLEEQLKNRCTNLQNILGDLLTTLPSKIINGEIQKNKEIPLNRPANTKDESNYPSIITLEEGIHYDDEKVKEIEKSEQEVAKLTFNEIIPVPYSEEIQKQIDESKLEGYGPGQIMKATLEIPLFTGLDKKKGYVPISLDCVLTFSGSTNETDPSPVEILFDPHARQAKYLAKLANKLRTNMEDCAKERFDWIESKVAIQPKLNDKKLKLFDKIKINDQLSSDSIVRARTQEVFLNNAPINSRRHVNQLKWKQKNKNNNKQNTDENKEIELTQDEANLQIVLQSILGSAKRSKNDKDANEFNIVNETKLKFFEFLTAHQRATADKYPTLKELGASTEEKMKFLNSVAFRHSSVIKVLQFIMYNNKVEANRTKIEGLQDLYRLQISKDYEIYYGEQREEDKKYFEESRKKYAEYLKTVKKERLQMFDNGTLMEKKRKLREEKAKQLKNLKGQLPPDILVPTGCMPQSIDSLSGQIFGYADDVKLALLQQIHSNFVDCKQTLIQKYAENPNEFTENSTIDCDIDKSKALVTLYGQKTINDLFTHDGLDVYEGAAAKQINDYLTNNVKLNGNFLKIGKFKISKVQDIKNTDYHTIEDKNTNKLVSGEIELYNNLFYLENAKKKIEANPINITIPFVLLQYAPDIDSEKNEIFVQFFTNNDQVNINAITSVVKNKLQKRFINAVNHLEKAQNTYTSDEVALDFIVPKKQACIDCYDFISQIKNKLNLHDIKQQKAKEHKKLESVAEKIAAMVKSERRYHISQDKSKKVIDQMQKVKLAKVPDPAAVGGAGKGKGKAAAAGAAGAGAGKAAGAAGPAKGPGPVAAKVPGAGKVAAPAKVPVPDIDPMEPIVANFPKGLMGELRKDLMETKESAKTEKLPKDDYAKKSDEDEDEEAKKLQQDYSASVEWAQKLLTENDRKSIKEEFINEYKLSKNEQWDENKFYLDMSNPKKPKFNYGNLTEEQKNYMDFWRSKCAEYNKKVEGAPNKERFKNYFEKINQQWKELSDYASKLNATTNLSIEQINKLCNEIIKNKIALVGSVENKPNSPIPLFNAFHSRKKLDEEYNENLVHFDPKTKTVYYGERIYDSKPTKIGRPTAEDYYKKTGDDLIYAEKMKELMNELNKKPKPSPGKIPLSENKVKAIQSDINALENEIKAEKKEETKMKELNKRFTVESNENLSPENREQKAIMNEHETEKDDLYLKYEKEQEEAERIKQELQEQNNKKLLEEKDKVIAYLKSQLNERLRQQNYDKLTIEQLVARQNELENMIQTLKDAPIKGTAEQIDSLQKELKQLKNLRIMKQSAKDAGYDLSGLQVNNNNEQLNELSEKYKTLSDEKNKLEKDNQDLSTKLKTTTEANKDLNAQLATTTAASAASSSKANEMEERYNQLADQWSYLDYKNNSLNSENSDLKKKIDELTNANNELTEQNNKLTEQNNELTKKNNEQSEQLKAEQEKKVVAAGTAALATSAAAKFLPSIPSILGKKIASKTATNVVTQGIKTVGQEIGKNLVKKTVSNLAAEGLKEAGEQVANTVADTVLEKGIETATAALT